MIDRRVDKFLVYNLFIDARYRIWRHIVLLLAIFLIAANQSYIIYLESYPKLDVKLPLLVLAIMVSYLITIYFNVYILIPRLLFAKKYLRYLSGLVLSIVFLVILLDTIEYVSYQSMGISMDESYVFNSEYSVLTDFVFTFSLSFVCITGSGITSLLRQWEVENKNILQLKNNYLQTEIEELKERISPDFLFNILNKAGTISVDNPDQSSFILVKLSHILRYQLYDCTRDKVLLGSEITFTRNYLNLYQLYNHNIEYNITVVGNMKHTFVPPLLFLPLIQLMVGKIKGKTALNIKFIIADNFTGFMCFVLEDNYDNEINISDIENMHRRLRYLYRDKYCLMANKKQVVLQLNEKE